MQAKITALMDKLRRAEEGNTEVFIDSEEEEAAELKSNPSAVSFRLHNYFQESNPLRVEKLLTLGKMHTNIQRRKPRMPLEQQADKGTQRTDVGGRQGAVTALILAGRSQKVVSRNTRDSFERRKRLSGSRIDFPSGRTCLVDDVSFGPPEMNRTQVVLSKTSGESFVNPSTPMKGVLKRPELSSTQASQVRKVCTHLAMLYFVYRRDLSYKALKFQPGSLKSVQHLEKGRIAL